MPNDFDENGNMRSAQIFPSGIEKIKQALGIVPPAMIYFVGTPQPGSILDALKTPNKDVDFAELMKRREIVDYMNEVEAKYDTPGRFQQFSKGMTFNPPTPYDGPDMNEVDAALEAIERMEE